MGNLYKLLLEMPWLRGIYHLKPRPTLTRMLAMHLDPAPSCKRRGVGGRYVGKSSPRGPAGLI